MVNISNTLTYDVPDGKLCSSDEIRHSCEALRYIEYYYKCLLFQNVTISEPIGTNDIEKCQECLDACAKALVVREENIKEYLYHNFLPFSDMPVDAQNYLRSADPKDILFYSNGTREFIKLDYLQDIIPVSIYRLKR